MNSLNHKTLGIIFLIGFFVLIGLTLLAIRTMADVPPVIKIKQEHGYKLEETTPRADNKIHGTARLSPAPVYYKKNGEYVSLQAGFVDKGRGVFELQDAPINIEIPKTYQGTHRLTSDNKKVWQMNPIGANVTQGQLIPIGTDFDGNMQNKLVFTDAFNGVDVEVMPFWGGYETNYTFKDPSVKDIHFDAEPEGTLLVTHGKDALDVQQDGSYVGFINKATATDKDGKNVAVSEIDTTIGAGKIITYSVNATSTQYPVKLDPLVRICSTSISGPCQQKITVDGRMRKNIYTGFGTCSTWANARNSTTAFVVSKTDTNFAIQTYDKDENGNHCGWEGAYLSFDTASVGAASFSSSSVVVHTTVQNGNWGNIALIDWVPATTTADLITTDYNSFANSYGRLGNDVTPSAGYKTWTMYSTTTGVLLINGNTTVAVVGANLADNVDIGGVNAGGSFGFDFSEISTTDSPQLIADYTAPAAASSNPDEFNWFFLLLKEIKTIFAEALQAYIIS